MARCVFRDGTEVADYGRPYVVAEVNSSHNGNAGTARRMIDAAAEIGCDCVKFQSWSAKSLYSATYYAENPIAKRFVDRFSLAPEALAELATYARAKDLAFSSTPYSEEEVDFLVDTCRAPYLKIASMELDNLDFLAYIGAKRVPLVLSTGMGTMEEIRRAVKTLETAGAEQMVLLHCVSIYPTKVETINLRNILGLRKAFPKYPIGFSDHTEGDAASVAAVALGAALIEKHLTLDHTKVGMDNGMATEPAAFSALVVKCRMVQQGLGAEERTVYAEEMEQRRKMRRSVIFARDLPAGHVLARSDLYAKRPGTGIAPDRMGALVGKTLARAVQADTLLCREDILEDLDA